ncbi:putative transporter (transmembrane protein) [Nocardioides sp. J9]|uniref:mechanosensitive ion channel family protein n=1 Tax=Nocardioides sp. J9 TaxID=935844 RepID=UPI0011A25252|nr:transporter [Nocardioides sp. J9]TWG91576.1 putative transporter (transmembrane protein) [Nocardioides sp. J9]
MDIENSLQNALDRFIGFLPNLIGFLVLLVIGWIVARLVRTAVRKGLAMTGIDDHMQRSRAHGYVERALPGASVSHAVALVAFWFVLVFFAVAAVTALDIPELTRFMNDVLAYLPNVLVAIAIFVVAALVSGGIAAAVSRTMGDTPTGRIVATVAPAVVMVIALFMILEQLQIAPEIVRIAFAATMGALALGLALAFGLGGRPVAQSMLEDAYRKGREEAERTRSRRHAGQASTSAAPPARQTPPPTPPPGVTDPSTSTQQFDPTTTWSTEGRGERP